MGCLARVALCVATATCGLAGSHFAGAASPAAGAVNVGYLQLGYLTDHAGWRHTDRHRRTLWPRDSGRGFKQRRLRSH